MRSATVDQGHQAHHRAGHEVGGALADRRAESDGKRLHFRMRHSDIRQDEGYETLLSEDEQALLRVFQSRRGQFLSLATLERLVREEHARVLPASASGDERASFERDLVPLLGSLSQKLRHITGAGRLFEVSGCGYILWH